MAISDDLSGLGVDKNDIFEMLSLGKTNSLATDGIKGIIHGSLQGFVPTDRELPGPLLITRPQLNLFDDNIRARPNLFPMLSSNPNSIERMTRCILDPRLMNTQRINGDTQEVLKCRLVDNRNPFIPVFNNDLISLSGFPDKILPSYSSEPGRLKEVWGQIDGSIDIFDERDINIILRNRRGSPAFSIIDKWCEYASDVFLGNVMPCPGFSVENEIDYQCRIYNLIMRQDGIRISRIAATGVSVPIVSPIGNYFNRDGATPYGSATMQHNFRFKSYGIIYDTNSLVRDFNEVSMMFNQEIRPKNRSSKMTKIPTTMRTYFKGYGYPFINDETLELEWWVDNNVFDEKLRRIAALNNIKIRPQKIMSDEERHDTSESLSALLPSNTDPASNIVQS